MAEDPAAMTISLPAQNRMLWRDDSGTLGKLWIIDNTGKRQSETLIQQTQPPQRLLGVAGDRVLWGQGTTAVIRTFNDAGAIDPAATVVTLPVARPQDYELRSIALATQPCWQRGAGQRYHLLWDAVLAPHFLVQLIDGTGRSMRVVEVGKPQLRARWFGLGADGYEEVVLTGGVGQRDVYFYRANWSEEIATYSLPVVAKGGHARADHQPMTGGRVVASPLVWAGTWAQAVYRSPQYSVDGGRAYVELYRLLPPMDPVTSALTGAPIVYAYAGGNGYWPTAFAGNPPLCP